MGLIFLVFITVFSFRRVVLFILPAAPGRRVWLLHGRDCRLVSARREHASVRIQCVLQALPRVWTFNHVEGPRAAGLGKQPDLLCPVGAGEGPGNLGTLAGRELSW